MENMGESNGWREEEDNGRRTVRAKDFCKPDTEHDVLVREAEPVEELDESEGTKRDLV